MTKQLAFELKIYYFGNELSQNVCDQVTEILFSIMFQHTIKPNLGT